MAKFRAKPREFEAEQFFADQKPWPVGVEFHEHCEALDAACSLDGCYYIQRSGGPWPLSDGDWIIPMGKECHVLSAESMAYEYLEVFESDYPTIEIDLAGSVLRKADLSRRIAGLSPRPAAVNVSIRRMATAWECMPDEGEPSFTVLGRDQLAQNTVVHWIERAIVAQVPEDKIQRARQRYQEIVDWQSENPDKVKTPD